MRAEYNIVHLKEETSVDLSAVDEGLAVAGTELATDGTDSGECI
jgi:hypothetical protein